MCTTPLVHNDPEVNVGKVRQGELSCLSLSVCIYLPLYLFYCSYYSFFCTYRCTVPLVHYDPEVNVGKVGEGGLGAGQGEQEEGAEIHRAHPATKGI